MSNNKWGDPLSYFGICSYYFRWNCYLFLDNICTEFEQVFSSFTC